MSSPYDGSTSDDNERGDNERAPGPGDYPAYRPTPHPEDTGHYGHPSYGMGYDQGYGQGQENWGQGRGHGYGYPPGEQGSGRIDVMRAISWGFRQAFRNWTVWILGVLVFLALSAVGGAIGGLFGTPAANGTGLAVSSGVNVLVSVLMMAIGVFVLRGTLHQVDDPGMGWGHFTRDVNFWPTLLLQLLIGLLTSALMFVVAGGAIAGFASEFADPTAIETATEEQLMASMGSLIGAILLVVLISVALNPLVVFMPYYLVERRADFAGAVREGFRAGVRNYLRLVLTYVVAGLLVILAVILTFGLATIVLIGPWYLAQAHMYRQAAGGALPPAVPAR